MIVYVVDVYVVDVYVVDVYVVDVINDHFVWVEAARITHSNST